MVIDSIDVVKAFFYKIYVDTQTIKGIDSAQETKPWALHGYKGPMAYENAFTKEAKELSRMGPKPNNKRKKKQGLENKAQKTPQRGASEEVLE